MIDIDKRELDPKWCKSQPDMAVIRRELKAGREIKGAKFSGWSYVLEPIRKKEEKSGEDQ